MTPASRGKGSGKLAAAQDEKIPAQRHVAMTWAQRLNHLQEKSPLDSEIRIPNPRAPDAGKIPGGPGMQNVLNGVSMPVGVMEKTLYSSYTPNLPTFINYLPARLFWVSSEHFANHLYEYH